MLVRPELNFGFIDRHTLLRRPSEVFDQLDDLWNGFNIGIIVRSAGLPERFKIVGEEEIVA